MDYMKVPFHLLLRQQKLYFKIIKNDLTNDLLPKQPISNNLLVIIWYIEVREGGEVAELTAGERLQRAVRQVKPGQLTHRSDHARTKLKLKKKIDFFRFFVVQQVKAF